MKKLLPVIIAALYLIIAVPAYAAVNNEVKTFGFTDERHRYTNVNGTVLYPMYFDNAGASYSQPLILDGSRWNMDGETVVIVVENNELKGYVIPESPGTKPEKVSAITPAWSKKLDGGTPTKSHPTYVEDKDSGKKYVYVGTYSSCLDIVDVTDFNNVSLVSVRSDLSTDITSAPLVLKWKGHDVVVATSGNTGNVFIITDPLDSEKMNNIYIKVGQGRTSSSPAPIAGGQGFAVGLDGGPNYGELKVYYLDNILTEDGQGKVIQKSGTSSIKKSLKSGLVASFCTDGSTIYFGDCQSRVYGYNVSTGSGWINGDSYGNFSNRSPALSPSAIYFPVVGAAGEQGKVVSVDRATGKTNWMVPMAGWDDNLNPINLGRAQTAPVILAFQQAPAILEGTSTGQLAIIDPVKGEMIYNFSITDTTGDIGYATGVAGEISVTGDIAVTTSETGMVVWQLVKPELDLAVTSLDLGVPEGEPAKPGQEYTGTVTFENLSPNTNTDKPAKININHNGYAAKLLDEQGQEVKEISLVAGQKVTFRFIWHGPTDAATSTFEAEVNLPPAMVLQEIRYDNNKLDRQISVAGYDIKVKIIPDDTNITTVNGEPTEITYAVAVTRKDDIPGSIGVTGAMTQTTVTDSFILNLAPGETKKAYNSFTAGPGTYTIEAEAWPDGTDDIYPSDNRDRVTVSVTSEKFEQKTGVHIERLR